MGSRRSEHGFTAVDQQPDPDAWVLCLDKIHREPFYAAYKKRIIELLEPRRAERYLELGAGAGDDSRAVEAVSESIVVALDRSFTMASTCRSRGSRFVLIGDASNLPFKDRGFDGCWADRVFQHLSEPQRALSEMVRVARSGARIVVVDPDYDTQVMEFPDRELAGRVLRFRAERGLRNGSIAHRMPTLLGDLGIEKIRVEATSLVVRNPAAVDNVMGLRTWAASAHASGCISSADAARWIQLYDASVEAGRFFYSVTFFVTSGMKP
ncbi:MAG: methyltransferase domain-containing protein [Candidatus Binataceae bacterium]